MNRMYAVILSSGTCVDFHFQHLIMEEMTWKCALSKNGLCNSYTRCCLSSTSFSEWIILHTGGQTWYNYFIPPISV